MVGYTLQQLQAMTSEQRHRLYKNARRIGGPEADAVIALLEEAGLPFSDPKCVTLDDPIVLKMYDIIHSKAGEAAMIQASAAGLPAMAGIDQLLLEALGVDYGGHNMTTATAGALVAERMQMFGYRKTGRKGQLPAGCVAKTAEIFERR